MTECKYKKSIQFYLDGYAKGEAARELEDHLKSCPRCQVEMAELVEVNGAALEIIDEAPSRSYWDSFATRVRNRIIARDVEPVEVAPGKKTMFPVFKLVSVFAILVFIAGASLLIYQSGQRIHPVALTSSNISTAEKRSESSLPTSSALGQSSIGMAAGIADGSNSPADPSIISGAKSSPKSPNEATAIHRGDRKFANLELKDPQMQFRLSSFPGRISQNLSNESKLSAPVSLADMDNPEFRLKNAFVGQRILASLNMNSQDAQGIAYQNPLYGSSPASLSSNDNNPGVSSTWGYLQIPSDTSRSSEIKKYFIELELMQNK